MKLISSKTNGYIVLSFEAENQAELHQLSDLRASLKRFHADMDDWRDLEGRTGIAVRVRIAPTQP